MKKWLNFLGVLGITTVSTATIVACGTSDNILSQSFSSSYKVDDYDNLASYGVNNNTENQTYDFSWSQLTIDLATIIKPIDNTVPVQKVSKNKDLEVESDELVAVYYAQDQSDLTINKENFITIKFKLNLYKGVKQETNEVKLIDQNIAYDVLLNVFVKPNLGSLVTPTVKSKKDVIDFKGNLAVELANQKNFSKIAIRFIEIANLDGTDFDIDHLIENDTHVKITLTSEGKKEFIGEKADLKVNWTADV